MIPMEATPRVLFYNSNNIKSVTVWMSEVGWQDIMQYSKILCNNSLHIGQSLTDLQSLRCSGHSWSFVEPKDSLRHSQELITNQFQLCEQNITCFSPNTASSAKRTAVTSNIQVTPSLIIRRHIFTAVDYGINNHPTLCTYLIGNLYWCRIQTVYIFLWH